MSIERRPPVSLEVAVAAARSNGGRAIAAPTSQYYLAGTPCRTCNFYRRSTPHPPHPPPLLSATSLGHSFSSHF